MLFFVLSFLMIFADETMSADIYDVEGKDKLFLYETRRNTTQDTMTYEAIYRDVKTNEIVAQEKAEALKGRLVRYEVKRVGPRDSGVIEVQDQKVRFFYDDAGKKSESKEDYKEPFVLSATFLPFVAAHMDDLLAKREVPFRYAVWYRRETIAFSLSLDQQDDKQFVIKMNPTNFLYKSLTKPIFITYETKTRKLISIRGRTLPKIKVGSAWKDLDVLALYK